MTRHAQPLAILRNPGVGKTPEMFIGLAAIGAFRMISTRHDRGRGIHSTFTSSILMMLGLNLGSAKSARNLPRSLTAPSYSVLINLSPIMLAMAVASRLTWAWFHIRSSPACLAAVSLEKTV